MHTTPEQERFYEAVEQTVASLGGMKTKLRKHPKPPTRSALARPVGSAPHWEHGYRCHGYWLPDNTRVGWVGLGPKCFWDKIYRWGVKLEGRHEINGEAKTLRHGKNMVERWYAAELAAAMSVPEE